MAENYGMREINGGLSVYQPHCDLFFDIRGYEDDLYVVFLSDEDQDEIGLASFDTREKAERFMWKMATFANEFEE